MATVAASTSGTRDRPRERLWHLGSHALTVQELLAILLGTGCAGRSALEVAAALLARVDSSIARLASRPAADVARVPGVGRAKAARVAAALELGRRRRSASRDPRTYIGAARPACAISRWRNSMCWPSAARARSSPTCSSRAGY